MPEKRTKYDREFREGAIRIVNETGRPIAQVARELGVNEGTLGNWVARDREKRQITDGLSTGDVKELKRLRAEVPELRMEREVSSDPWSCRCWRRRSECGPFRRRPEDHLPGAACEDLSVVGTVRILVLQVAAAGRSPGRAAHRHRPSPGRGRRRCRRVPGGARVCMDRRGSGLTCATRAGWCR